MGGLPSDRRRWDTSSDGSIFICDEGKRELYGKRYGFHCYPVVTQHVARVCVCVGKGAVVPDRQPWVHARKHACAQTIPAQEVYARLSLVLALTLNTTRKTLVQPAVHSIGRITLNCRCEQSVESRVCPPPITTDQEVVSEYRLLEDGQIQARIRLAGYLNPNDVLFFASEQKAVTLSDYSLVLKKVPPVRFEAPPPAQ